MAPLKSKRGGSAVDKRVVRQIVHGAISGMQEHKNVSVALTAAASATAGAVFPITQYIIQGDDLNARSGDMVKIGRLTVRGCFTEAGVGLVNAQRLIIFSDTMNNGAAPAVLDVLESASVYSGYDQVNYQRHRFKIYHDKIYSQVAATNTGKQIFESTTQVNKRIYFNAGSFAAASNGKGAIWYLVIAENAASATHTIGWQVDYTDS